MRSSDNFPPFFWAGSILVLMALVKNIAASGDDCTPPGRSDLKCTILPTQACKDRDDSLYVPAQPNDYPNSARDLKIDQYQFLHTNGKYYTRLNITFKGPDSVDLLYVKAFEVKLTIMSGGRAGTFLCRILNLTAANITDVNSMVQTKFSLFGLTVMQNTQYLVNVRSLPEPSTTNSDAKDIYKYINTPSAEIQKVDINNTANWAFFIETVFDERELTVSFSKPPEEYKFTQFLVQLIRHDIVKDKKVAVKREVTGDYSVVFEKINLLIPGLYQVAVEPYLNRKCPCKMNGRCESCSISITSEFNITFGIGTEAPIATTVQSSWPSSTVNTPGQPVSEPSTMSTQAPAGLGLLLGVSIPVTIILVALLVVVIIFLYRRCESEDHCPIIKSQKEPLQSDGPDDFYCSNVNGVPVKSPGRSQTPPMPIALNTSTTILLLYYADDESHKRAVFCLADFLEGHCSMKVFLHDRCTNDISSKGQDNWVVEKIKMVDWIVILNSEGAYEQYKLITKPCQQDSYILSDMFLCAIKMLDRYTDVYKHKFISAYFPYTNKKDLILQFTPKGIHYKLMDDLEQFFLRVNNYEKYNKNEVIDAAIANSREYYFTEPGRQLREIMNWKMKHTSGTSGEADVEHQNNFDSGIESGFKNHPFGNFKANVKNLKPEGLFDPNWGDGDDDSSGSLRDPDSLSCGSIGSAGRAEFDKFYRDCPVNGLYTDYQGMTRPNYQQEANDIDVSSIVPMDI
ncbi:uncharacterized protein LOC135482614 isoform X2 [Lineus longissimus]|uniref:uncharacterized protein LOC135482614 isoform X2 n=1 Tax=Lineus longissimus TaxID=88925 RepID=UPI00315D8800